MEIDSEAVTELPAYRAFLVVDMKDFSGERGRDHARLTERIPELLRQTFQRCGLADLWEEALFEGSTGDGYYLGFSSRLLPFLLNPFLPALQEELAYQNSVSRQTIRMRVSINVGPMTGPGAISEGSGDTRIETHRLLDSEPVRDLLNRSGAVTCVAGIVSARAFEDAVLPGYSDEAPDLYVPAPVEVKSYQGTAYLRVPHPSGDLLSNGFHLGSDVESALREERASRLASSNTANDARGAVAQDGSRSSAGVGDISGSNNKVTSVQGDQHNGPHYEGPQDHSSRSYGDGHIHVSGGNKGGIHQHPRGRGKQ